MRIDKWMKLSVFRYKSVLVDTDVGFIQLIIFVFFEKTSQYDHVVGSRNSSQFLDARSIGNRLGKFKHLLPRQMASKSIASHRALVKCNYVCALCGSLL